jgi:pimeloyl-ACP methyl ester carboxylesterase
MQRKTVPATVFVMTLFFFSACTLFVSAVVNFPERYATQLQESDYDLDYWNLTDCIAPPVTVNNISTIIDNYESQEESIPLVEWYFNFESESLQSGAININSVVLRRQDISNPRPAILYLHGYGEEFNDYIEVLRKLAATGNFVVMGIDHPGSGNTTNYPALTPYTFLNITESPRDSSLYHSVWAGIRAITLIDSLSYVDDNAIVVMGNSMGAWTTLMVSSLDSRVDGVVPMIAGGNLMNSIISGSLINGVIEPSYTIDSEEMSSIIRWFDPIAYAKNLTQPTLMLFGSNDDFFPVVSMIDTVEAISAPLTLSIVPNWGHGVYSSWFDIIPKWINEQFLSGAPLPMIHVSFDEQLTVQGGMISVNVNVTHANRALICWRSSEPGAAWLLSEMNTISEGPTSIYSKNITPWLPGKVSFFVIVEQDDMVRISSGVLTAYGGSFLLPLLLLLSTSALGYLIWKGEWRPTEPERIREYPYILGMFLLGLGFTLPFTIIRGRTTLSVLEIIEIFGNSFFLKGWFLPSFIASLCFVLSLSAYRHRFQFKVAGLLWTPVLIALVILFIVLTAIFGFFGTLTLVDLGVGGPVFLSGIVIMQLLDKTVRERIERRIEQTRQILQEIGDQYLRLGEE